MRFIPRKIKNLFTRKSKKAQKEAIAVPAAAAAEAAAPAPDEAKIRQAAEKRRARQEKKLESLARSKTGDGIYALDLDIGQPSPAYDGRTMVMVSSREADYYRAFIGSGALAGGNRVAQDLKEFLKEECGLDSGKAYLRLKNEKFYLHAEDEYIGLPPGDAYQILIVPEGVKWKPPVYVPARRAAPAGSDPLLQPPLLPPYLRAQPDNPQSGPRFR